MFRIWSEWDFGLDGFLFESVEQAREFIVKDANFLEFMEDKTVTPMEYLLQLEADGLFSYDELTVVK